MSKLNRSKSAILFVDYKPAELRKNKDWLIVYYSKIPAKNELKRFRVRVPKISSVKERTKYAKRMVEIINQKLQNGWSPFYENENNKYKSVTEVFSIFFKLLKKEVQDKVKRIDTLRSYSSFHTVFTNYLEENHSINFLLEIDNYTINCFLDYIYLKRRVSPTTYNNYLQFLKTFFSWSTQKGYIQQSPVENFKSKPKSPKKRVVLTNSVKQKLKIYGEEYKSYYTLCMCTYYSFIRKTELTKIKVADVNIAKGFITILGTNSKNRKTENVTIPNALLPLLKEHLKNAKKTDFLFSHDEFASGKKQLSPKKISDHWAKFRKKNDLPLKYQYYSLKDTGITDLLNSGIPAIKVRDQARHHDLKITESYTQRNDGSDEIVKNADFKF
ncbi:tyrosine-type recombinase/integrase [Tenacibaculum maritimum]|uniref:tyrosine-type recombinase/integrase n=1 Tax=Tenacibaculum maritimum TaxID=107401 RepID=UPI0012E514D6|nr:site-specific integrase [Tenacibaculum maritimum]CAA0156103.1 Site-specific recombinase, phage integrase family [Tenacibaculum maritimum]CAA0169422.1 Site-specific recombinase, phage integrase family [Tenacibaculum maritimum]CAA0172018.1 Site-specific recombinase, phage integrase family [Tenacibaculum maritimum]CAA0238170.1 Site-specific recombinase, phage integrase family [Tenacibaculum maritimum]